MSPEETKPRVFIGSSRESINVARAVREVLRDCTEPVMWDERPSKLSRSTLGSLCDSVDSYDFGIFVFSPDDSSVVRDTKYATARDNVVFELGLFTGRLGRERTFFITPEGGQDFRIPTDLSGITCPKYDPNVVDEDPANAVKYACDRIRTAIRDLGSVACKSSFLDSSVDALVKGLSCLAVYAPIADQHQTENTTFQKANDTRNAAKSEAISRASEAARRWAQPGRSERRPVIWLVAEAGPTYLSGDTEFRGRITEFVRAGGLLRVLLSAPWERAGEVVSKSYHQPNRIDPDSGWHRDFKTKYEQSLLGCIDLSDPNHRGNVELHISRIPVPCTLLVTIDRVFFEPYLFSNRSKKLERRFDTFELELAHESQNDRTVWVEHLEFMWCCVSDNATDWLKEQNGENRPLIPLLREHFKEEAEAPRIDISDDNVALISEHDTWISIDPLVGCPACCAYCFVKPRQRGVREPSIRRSPREMVHELRDYLAERNRGWQAATGPNTPVCIGNYTDMLMSEQGRKYLLEYVELHAWHLPEFPLCVATKAVVDSNFLDELDAVGYPVLLFLSQSFMKQRGFAEIEPRGTCTDEQTVEAVRSAAKTRNIRPLHFWRPITPETVPSASVARDLIKPLKDAGCLASVAVGFKCKSGVPRKLKKVVGGDVKSGFRGEHFPEEFAETVFSASHELQYPVFRNTSCAVAFALERQESLGSWGNGQRRLRCDPCYCPDEQKRRCNSAREASGPPGPSMRLAIARAADVAVEHVTWSEEYSRFEVKGKMKQHVHSRLVHLSGAHIKPEDFDLTLAWPGWILMTGE